MDGKITKYYKMAAIQAATSNLNIAKTNLARINAAGNRLPSYDVLHKRATQAVELAREMLDKAIDLVVEE